MRRPIKLNFQMSQYILILSLFFSMFSIQKTEQLLCPNSCECSPGGQEIICDGSNDDTNNLMNSLQSLKSIKILTLKNLKTIDKNIFLETIFNRLTQMRVFRLESSSLSSNVMSIKIDHELKAETLLSVSMVSCQIRLIDSNVLSKWSNLKMISLANNIISQLDRTWFHPNLNSLWSLDLSYNSISSIPTDFFKGMPALRKLRLDNNSFKTLHYEWFKPIWNSALQEFWINQNPINCTYELGWIVNFTKYPTFFEEASCFDDFINFTRYFWGLRVGDEDLIKNSTKFYN